MATTAETFLCRVCGASWVCEHAPRKLRVSTEQARPGGTLTEIRPNGDRYTLGGRRQSSGERRAARRQREALTMGLRLPESAAEAKLVARTPKA